MTKSGVTSPAHSPMRTAQALKTRVANRWIVLAVPCFIGLILWQLAYMKADMIQRANRSALAIYSSRFDSKKNVPGITLSARMQLQELVRKYGPVQRAMIVRSYSDIWPIPCIVELCVERRRKLRIEVCTLSADQCISVSNGPDH